MKILLVSLLMLGSLPAYTFVNQDDCKTIVDGKSSIWCYSDDCKTIIDGRSTIWCYTENCKTIIDGRSSIWCE